jgi:hypothetical protein
MYRSSVTYVTEELLIQLFFSMFLSSSGTDTDYEITANLPMLAATLTFNLIIYPSWKELLWGTCIAEPQSYAKKENLFNESGYFGCEGLFWEIENTVVMEMLQQQSAKQNMHLQVCL